MRVAQSESIRPLALGATRKIVQVVTTTAPSIAEWQPFREPLRATLTRTIGIALVGGFLLSLGRGGIARWPVATVVMLWPALGGHFLELWFLNWLRPRLPRERGVQVVARVVLWFLGGVVFVFAMWLTAGVLTGQMPAVRPAGWNGGLAFIGIELVAQLVLHLRGLPSFYDGRG